MIVALLGVRAVGLVSPEGDALPSLVPLWTRRVLSGAAISALGLLALQGVIRRRPRAAQLLLLGLGLPLAAILSTALPRRALEVDPGRLRSRELRWVVLLGVQVAPSRVEEAGTPVGDVLAERGLLPSGPARWRPAEPGLLELLRQARDPLWEAWLRQSPPGGGAEAVWRLALRLVAAGEEEEGVRLVADVRALGAWLPSDPEARVRARVEQALRVEARLPAPR